MEIIETGFEGLVEIIPKVLKDKRGYFLETFRVDMLDDYGLSSNFIQDNQSLSVENVIRGLHLQLPPFEQIKLVRAARGKAMDIVVDTRQHSRTFGKHYKCLLEGDRGNMLYIPAGFAHGIAVLTETILSYKCSSYYNKESETGINFDDPKLNIDWGIEDPIVTEKDRQLPSFDEFCDENALE